MKLNLSDKMQITSTQWAQAATSLSLAQSAQDYQTCVCFSRPQEDLVSLCLVAYFSSKIKKEAMKEILGSVDCIAISLPASYLLNTYLYLDKPNHDHFICAGPFMRSLTIKFKNSFLLNFLFPSPHMWTILLTNLTIPGSTCSIPP